MISILKKLKHQSKLFELYKFVTGRIEEAQLKQVCFNVDADYYSFDCSHYCRHYGGLCHLPLFATYRESLEQFLFPPCFRDNTAYK